MIHQAYDLNAYIPNIELVLYNIFMTPITTAELKKQSEDKDDLLVGNLFAKNKVPLGSDAYKSICETMTLRPKKKNLKRLIQYIDTVESKETMDKEVIDRLVHICIDQRYPILLGKTVKNWI
jgi:PHD/YefM family antitoxin component YafN of YafNO toxin-antitoxin module